MCGRINQQDVLKKKDAQYDQKLTRLHRQKRVNVTPGMLAMIITQNGVDEAEFGFRPEWDNSKMLINARLEGNANSSNEPDGWQVGINQTPSFKNAFNQHRCIIPVNSFIEGPEKEKLSKPYLIKSVNDELLYLGGLYTTYKNKSGLIEKCFAIITTPPNPTCLKIGHHRSPYFLIESEFDTWLNPSTQNIANFTLESSRKTINLEAYPLDPNLVKSGKLHEEYILNPLNTLL